MVGPTGTGKSALAVGLAERLAGEIISCDALQVYRELEVATAKPSMAERRSVPHHLIDHVDPRRDYSLADFIREADRAIGTVVNRGNVPIVAGGTGLYLRGLLRGIVAAPARNPELRERLRAMAVRRGIERMHRWLSRLDPAGAERVGPRDSQRIIRALELALSGNGTWGEILERQGTWDRTRERYRALKIGLECDPERLNRRLDERVEQFFAAGLVDEVRRLLDRGVPPQANAFRAIGYREVLAALERGQPPERTAGEVQRNTRRYAKRQRTWFRGEPGVIWIDADRPAREVVDEAAALWQRFDG